MMDEIADKNLEGFVAIFRPVPDILSFRTKYMNCLFEGQVRTILEFQPIDLQIEDPKISKQGVKFWIKIFFKLDLIFCKSWPTWECPNFRVRYFF